MTRMRRGLAAALLAGALAVIVVQLVRGPDGCDGRYPGFFVAGGLALMAAGVAALIAVRPRRPPWPLGVLLIVDVVLFLGAFADLAGTCAN